MTNGLYINANITCFKLLLYIHQALQRTLVLILFYKYAHKIKYQIKLIKEIIKEAKIHLYPVLLNQNQENKIKKIKLYNNIQYLCNIMMKLNLN